jgi:hypothetical protein
LSRIYFTDRDLGKQFPARLREAGPHVERFFNHFGRWWRERGLLRFESNHLHWRL